MSEHAHSEVLKPAEFVAHEFAELTQSGSYHDLLGAEIAANYLANYSQNLDNTAASAYAISMQRASRDALRTTRFLHGGEQLVAQYDLVGRFIGKLVGGAARSKGLIANAGFRALVNDGTTEDSFVRQFEAAIELHPRSEHALKDMIWSEWRAFFATDSASRTQINQSVAARMVADGHLSQDKKFKIIREGLLNKKML